MIYMTYHRQGKDLRIAVIFETRAGVYFVYTDIWWRNDFLQSHWFDSVTSAQIHAEQRYGVPLDVWVYLTDTIPLPDKHHDFSEWATHIANLLAGYGLKRDITTVKNVNNRVLKYNHRELIAILDHIRLLVETSLPDEYVEWLLTDIHKAHVNVSSGNAP